MQQGCPYFAPLGSVVDRQPSQNQYRSGIGHVAAHAAVGGFVRDRPCCYRVVAVHEALGVRDNKGATGAARLVCECSALEPFIEAACASLTELGFQNVEKRGNWFELN